MTLKMRSLKRELCMQCSACSVTIPQWKRVFLTQVFGWNLNFHQTSALHLVIISLS